MNRTTFILLILLFLPCRAMSQRIVLSSDDVKPRWISRTGDIRQSNPSYNICLVEDLGPDLHVLKNSSLLALSRKLEQSNSISGVIDRNVNVSNSDGTVSSESSIGLSFQTRTDVIDFTCKAIASYWEQFTSGTAMHFRYYTLYAVSKPGVVPVFDNFEVTTKYGARGLWRSMIVPGWGQMYKGSYMKGGLMLGGMVVLATGITLAENLRQVKAAAILNTHNADLKQIYASQANGCAIARNICIGGAAALYIYNLVDAVVAPGAKRIKVQSNGIAVKF